MSNLQSMILVKGTVNWTGTKKATFKMIPTTLDCPYLEAIFDREHMALGLVGKYKKSNYEMVPTLDKNGDFMPKKKKLKEGEFPFQQEKRQVESWNEYEILTKTEIMDFIKLFAINADTFDVEQFFIPQEEPRATVTPTPFIATVTEKKEPEMVN